MARYVCIFYKTKNISEISKLNKSVIIIEKDNWSECYNELNSKYDFPLIKYVRNMKDSNTIIYNIEFFEIEAENNLKIIKND